MFFIQSTITYLRLYIYFYLRYTIPHVSLIINRSRRWPVRTGAAYTCVCTVTVFMITMFRSLRACTIMSCMRTPMAIAIDIDRDTVTVQYIDRDHDHDTVYRS